MPSVNPHTREVVFKLVFYGPGLGGKTTTLQYIHAATKPQHRGKMVSLATPTDRTLYFDFLPIRVPRVKNLGVRLQLFTVPGQAEYAATRRLVLSGADGVVFVGDSQAGRREANEQALEDLHRTLKEHGRVLVDMPHTFQWNKRDLGDLDTVEALDARFNRHKAPSLGTVATKGDGIFEGLERITRGVLRKFEFSAGTRPVPEDEVESAAQTRGVPTEALAQALRQIEGPTKVSVVLPESTRATGAVTAAPARATVAYVPSVQAERDTSPARAARPMDDEELVAVHAAGTSFSFAEVWPEAEREAVRKVEAKLGARDTCGAVLACEALVTRMLASAAGVAGTADAPRDPAVVTLLLGLDGGRYLRFRGAARAARCGEPLPMERALHCFAFVLEVQRARDLVRT